MCYNTTNITINYFTTRNWMIQRPPLEFPAYFVWYTGSTRGILTFQKILSPRGLETVQQQFLRQSSKHDMVALVLVCTDFLTN